MSIDKIKPEDYETLEQVEERVRDEDKMMQAFDNIEDMINHPPHYNKGGLECIEYIKQQLGGVGFRAYLEGNVIKYIHRHKYKDQNISDLKKAIFYLERLVQEYEDM